MSGRETSSPKPSSGPKPSSRLPSASKRVLIDNYIRRICIDPSVDLGSLYDARIESKVGQLILNKSIITKISQQKEIQCEVMKADMIDRKDIFHKVGIHEEPWLNSVLNIVPPEGMTALINYSFPKSSNTRFLYYYYASEEKAIFQTKDIVLENISKFVPDIAVTHVISAIKLGVQALIVLQLSPDNEIDLTRLLEITSNQLSKNRFQISKNEKTLFNQIVVRKVFSNIPVLNNMSILAEICQKLTEIKPHVFRHLPLEFTLRTIKWFYSFYPNEKARYTALEPDVVTIINNYLLTLSAKIEALKTALSSQNEQILKERLRKQYDAFQQQIVDAEKIYSNERERLRKLVIQIRSGIIQQELLIERLSEEFNKSLQSKIGSIEEYLESLQKKLKLINKFDENKITYLDMQQHPIQQNDDLNAVFHKLDANGKSELIFCTDDDLRDQNFDEWNEKCDNWMQKGENDSSLTLIYADFTYASYHLSKIRILLIKSTDNAQRESKSSSLSPQATTEPLLSLREKTLTKEQQPMSTTAKHKLSRPGALAASQVTPETNDQSKVTSPILSTHAALRTEQFRSSSSSTMKYVNILLLGEAGVGKSTFINTLVNYYAFETFEQARSNQLLVAIPVSFLMTVGDHFEEKIVRFGGIDPNEDHDHPGQSVTQQCRSYVFQIGTQTKLRLIDTPGMSDTRGLDQDDLNMQHILSFISNLPHLNAICILLKPNGSRLNVVLPSYFTRLLNFLGENARNHIVFCFTNTRATSFALGNTGPLLKKMISSLPIKGIPFEKRNTFCFNSESFRYLVALQNGVQFDAYQERKYEQSWKTSSITSMRLIQYVSEELKPYKRNDWQSIEHAQFTINQLIRPILENTRNILRDITLLKETSPTLLIKLRPIAIIQPSAICYGCPRTPKRISDFWILPDSLHTLYNTCNDCVCDRTKHIDVNYSLEYELIGHEDMQSFEKMKWDLDQLRKVIVDLSQFYGYVVDTLKQNDPLLSALKRIIAEEKQICSDKGAECLNSTLHGIFTNLTEEYKERRTRSISVHLPVDLPGIYELIDHISQVGEVNEQMRAIKQTKKRYLRQYEKQVS